MESIATIGYEGATVAGFLDVLVQHDVQLVIDIRAIAGSRRPGFAKTAMTANLQSVGIDYLHLRALGTPADGRAAARAGKHDQLRKIYLAHLAMPDAQNALRVVADLVHSGRRACLLCLEADPTRCHRSFVAEALASMFPLEIHNLVVADQFAD